MKNKSRTFKCVKCNATGCKLWANSTDQKKFLNPEILCLNCLGVGWKQGDDTSIGDFNPLLIEDYEKWEELPDRPMYYAINGEEVKKVFEGIISGMVDVNGNIVYQENDIPSAFGSFMEDIEANLINGGVLDISLLK